MLVVEFKKHRFCEIQGQNRLIFQDFLNEIYFIFNFLGSFVEFISILILECVSVLRIPFGNSWPYWSKIHHLFLKVISRAQINRENE